MNGSISKLSFGRIADGAFLLTLATGVLFLLGSSRTLVLASVYKLPRDVFRVDLWLTIADGAEWFIRLLASLDWLFSNFSNGFAWLSITIALAGLWILAKELPYGRGYVRGVLVILGLWVTVYYHAMGEYSEKFYALNQCLQGEACKSAHTLVTVHYRSNQQYDTIEGFVIAANANYWIVLSSEKLRAFRSSEILSVERIVRM